MRAVLAVVLLLLAAPAAAGPVDDYAAIAERLSLMKPVAAWQQARGVPVEDLAREAVVLKKATAAAGEQGLDAASTSAFFQAQIEAAKAIQRCWLARWQGTPPAGPVPDLVEEIRPEFIRLGSRIVPEIRVSLDAGEALGPSAAFDEAVVLDCLDPEYRTAMVDVLARIKLAE